VVARVFCEIAMVNYLNNKIYVIKYPKIHCTVWYISCSCVLSIFQKSLVSFNEFHISFKWSFEKNCVCTYTYNHILGTNSYPEVS